MRLPIDQHDFSAFIEASDIFKLTRDAMRRCLENWYRDECDQFVENLRADFDTVMGTYRFHDTMVSFNKDFNFDTPLDTISCKITIHDAEDDYCLSYQAIFDYDLNMIDDVVC